MDTEGKEKESVKLENNHDIQRSVTKIDEAKPRIFKLGIVDP